MDSRNKTILTNTIFLYFRMIVTMAVGFISSRVVLRELGIEGYGIYNIVGGVVVFLSFISNSLRNASQRFLSYEISKGNQANIRGLFDIVFQSHILLCGLIIIVAETLGVWFVGTLKMPANSYYAASVVYQLSIATFIIQIIQLPYYSLIISYERMSFYAWISIGEAVLKLLLLVFLIVIDIDKLILYSILVAASSLIILISIIIYCKYKFSIYRIRFHKYNSLFKRLFSFSGWSMFNGGANLLAQQGSNYILNLFSGVAVNAAFGIANQLSSLIYSFVSNFQTAFQPQIVKRYALNEIQSLNSLVFRSASLSIYLLLIISVPFCLESEFLLKLWLGIVPEYASIFSILLLVFFLIDSVQSPLWMYVYATGDIKKYSLTTGFITLLNIPLSWLLLFKGFPLYFIFIVKIVLNCLCSAYRLFYLKCYENFPWKTYLFQVVGRAVVVAFFSVCSMKIIMTIICSPICTIAFSIIVTCVFILLIGLNKNDKTIVKQYIIKRLSRCLR